MGQTCDPPTRIVRFGSSSGVSSPPDGGHSHFSGHFLRRLSVLVGWGWLSKGWPRPGPWPPYGPWRPGPPGLSGSLLPGQLRALRARAACGPVRALRPKSGRSTGSRRSSVPKPHAVSGLASLPVQFPEDSPRNTSMHFQHLQPPRWSSLLPAPRNATAARKLRSPAVAG